MTDSARPSIPAFGRFAGKWWLLINGGLRLRRQRAAMMDTIAMLNAVAESANIRRVGALERRFCALVVCGLRRQQNGQLAAARVRDGRMECGRGWW